MIVGVVIHRSREVIVSYFSKILIYLLLFSVKAIGAELRSGTNLQTLPEPQEGRIDTNGKLVPQK